MSVTHPKLKTTLTAGTGIKVVPLTYPRLPENKEDLEFCGCKVYTTEGVRGFFVSPNDKATMIVAGFWEEYFDLGTACGREIQEIVEREEARRQGQDLRHRVPRSSSATSRGDEAAMMWVLWRASATMIVILWFYFRSWQGVVIPILSGAAERVWGLGFAGLFGFNLDPLVLVVPCCISARAHSHSVQSMERYHEEYDPLQRQARRRS